MAAAKQREERRWRRARSAGIIGTVVIHFLLLILFRQVAVPPPSQETVAGPPAGDIRPAAGGSGLTMVEVRPEQPPPVEEVTIPVPVPEEIVITPEEVEVAAPSPEPVPEVTPSLPGSTAPGAGGDQQGPATGAGVAAGGGDGGGGTAEVVPPTPRGVFIPPPGQPASARGQEITVWVYVTDRGRVERNSVRLEPPTSDSRYNQRLIQSVAEWVFDPARQEGMAVAVWYPFQIIL
jgi:hypothetical protein